MFESISENLNIGRIDNWQLLSNKERPPYGYTLFLLACVFARSTDNADTRTAASRTASRVVARFAVCADTRINVRTCIAVSQAPDSVAACFVACADSPTGGCTRFAVLQAPNRVAACFAACANTRTNVRTRLLSVEQLIVSLFVFPPAPISVLLVSSVSPLIEPMTKLLLVLPFSPISVL